MKTDMKSRLNAFIEKNKHAFLLLYFCIYFPWFHHLERTVTTHFHVIHTALDDLTLEQFKSISPVFEEDIYDAISMKTCVEKRVTIGAPGAEAMKKVIEVYKKELNA